MDPLTGIVTLAGVSIVGLLGLRLKKQATEGFAALPSPSDQYRNSVAESQTRYNEFTSLVNPLINGVIPVGSSSGVVKASKQRVNAALGSNEADYSAVTMKLQQFKNKFPVRSDGNESVFAVINFCKETGKGDKPFGQVKDGLSFNDYCGVCVSSGVDELGKAFKTQQGLVLDKGTRDAAIKEKTENNYLFPRVTPPLASCDGAPDGPVFAINQADLDLFKKRQYCTTKRQLDPKHGCALCYENDTYSYVDKNTETQKISLEIRGTGTAIIQLKGKVIKTIRLSATTQQVDLINADASHGKEGDIFFINVTPIDATATTDVIPATVYGYFKGSNANGGSFTMPLNLLLLSDSVSNTSPKKSGFTSVDKVTVAYILPGAGKTTMNLKGTIPFTFVEPDDFSAIDCINAPYQIKEESVNNFSTDQPCYAKGSAPGKYNEDCLKSIILNAGCTSAGTLYTTDYKTLNTGNKSLDQIYTDVSAIAQQDGIDPTKTKQCSGRNIVGDCDSFAFRPDMKFTGNANAKKCLTYLYKNKGSGTAASDRAIGPTYLGSTTYLNNTASDKNRYCLPEGALNPDSSVAATATAAIATLSGIADAAITKGASGIQAVKTYLNSQLDIAVDTSRNANTDPVRKAAILNCFGSFTEPFENFRGDVIYPLPLTGSTSPTVVTPKRYSVSAAYDLDNLPVWPGDGGGPAVISKTINYNNYSRYPPYSAGMWDPFPPPWWFAYNREFKVRYTGIEKGASIGRIRLYFCYPGDGHIISSIKIKETSNQNWQFNTGALPTSVFGTDNNLWYYDAILSNPIKSSSVDINLGNPLNYGWQLYLIKVEFWSI